MAAKVDIIAMRDSLKEMIADSIKQEGLEEKNKKPFAFTDMCYVRFIRANKLDLIKAHKNMISTIRWRVEVRADHIVEKDCAAALEKNIVSLYGSDKDSRPVIWVLVKDHDKNNRDLGVFQKMIIYLFEESLRRSIPEEERVVVVFDLLGFTYKNADMDLIKQLVSILQEHYTETLSVALIINAPFIFSAIWAVIKVWLDPITAAKVLFVNVEDLPNYIPIENIPERVALTPKMEETRQRRLEEARVRARAAEEEARSGARGEEKKDDAEVGSLSSAPSTIQAEPSGSVTGDASMAFLMHS